MARYSKQSHYKRSKIWLFTFFIPLSEMTVLSVTAVRIC